MSRIAGLSISDDGFVFDPTTGESFLTNQTGLLIFQMLQSGKSDETFLLKQIINCFQVPAEIAARDLSDFMERLSAMKLI